MPYVHGGDSYEVVAPQNNVICRRVPLFVRCGDIGLRGDRVNYPLQEGLVTADIDGCSGREGFGEVDVGEWTGRRSKPPS